MKEFFKTLNPSLVFVCTLLCLPAVLFQKSLVYLWADIVVFVFLLALKKGSLRILPPLIICISVVFFNLFAPDGLVLFSVFGFKVTLGALQNGLHKSGILLAMVFISQYAVSRNLHLPGKTGGFLSRMFWYFDRLSEKSINEKAAAEHTGKRKLQRAAKRSWKSFFSLIGDSVSALIDKTDERLLQVFLSEPEVSVPAVTFVAESRIGKKVLQQGKRFLFSSLPLFPVYVFFILSLFDLYPV